MGVAGSTMRTLDRWPCSTVSVYEKLVAPRHHTVLLGYVGVSTDVAAVQNRCPGVVLTDTARSLNSKYISVGAARTSRGRRNIRNSIVHNPLSMATAKTVNLELNARTIQIHGPEKGGGDIDTVNINGISDLEEITHVDPWIHKVRIRGCPNLRYIAPMYNRYIEIEDCPTLQAVYTVKRYGRPGPYFPGRLRLVDCPSIRTLSLRDGMSVDTYGYNLYEIWRIFAYMTSAPVDSDVRVHVGEMVAHYKERFVYIDAALALYKKLPEDLLRMLWTAIVH